MSIQESGQMYLETILVLSKNHDKVRAIDVANEMNFSKPSVSVALKLLKESGHIEINNNFITLTELGKKEASKVYQRHQVLEKFFISIGVPWDIAEKDACKIEHHISDVTLAKLKEHINWK